MAQRVYKAATIFNARVVGMNNLWEPSREYMGKPVEKPSYMITVILPKTRANWFEEPNLSDFARASEELYNAALSHIPFPQIGWPIADGDVPGPGRANPEWRQGTWVLTGTSTSPITVKIVQNGVPVPLLNRMNVKPGDYVGLGVSIAVKMNDPRGVKCYCNNVMFMAPGEEIAVGSSVSAIDLMAAAREQGMNVTGFGGGGAPQQGFGQGFAQTAAPPSGTNGLPSGFTFPSSGLAPPPVAPPAQQGFATPSGFNAPSGFPPRK